MSGNDQQKTTRPVPVARASMAWDDVVPQERTRTVAPASSVLSRITVERKRTGVWHEDNGTVFDCLPGAAVGALVGAVVAVTAGTVTAGLPATVAATTLAGALVGAVWSKVTGGWVVRELRHQVRREQRVAASLAPLESAGWTVLHDRLVAAHRVPHVLVGPAGVRPSLRLPGRVVVALPGPQDGRASAQRRRSGAGHAAGHAAPSWAARVVHRDHHHLRHPGPDALRTAVWARTELAGRLGRRPELDGWTVTVSSLYVLLSRPNDRTTDSGTGVGFTDVGARTRTHLETASPSGLSRDAAAFLAVVVDDACPPHDPPNSLHPRPGGGARHHRGPGAGPR